jgi:hypothetical protein
MPDRLLVKGISRRERVSRVGPKKQKRQPVGLTPVLPTVAAALDFAERLNACSAVLLGNWVALLEDLHLLDVDLPLGSGGFLGPGPVVAKLGAFTAFFTLSHLFTPYQKRGRSHHRDEQGQFLSQKVWSLQHH